MKIVASDYYNNLTSDDRIPHGPGRGIGTEPPSHLDDLRPGLRMIAMVMADRSLWILG